MGNFIVKKTRKYVIATLDENTKYFSKLFGEYAFVTDITYATKTYSKTDAEFMIKDYYRHTGYNIDLVVLPLDITYELVNENNDEE